MDLKKYGFTQELMPENAQGLPARVTAVFRERYGLICEFGEIWGRLKTKEYYDGEEKFPTVGDFVLIDYCPDGDSRILRTLPRRTYFSRRDPTPGRGEQAVAANFDTVFIMQSLNQNFNVRRLERYLTLAWQSGAVPVIVLTKADLVMEAEEAVREAEKAAAGARICVISAKTGYGLDGLAEYVGAGKTIVLLGSSGVGKSSLVNALAQEVFMEVGEIRESDGRGRHTTTHRQLFMLKSGAMLIDTPGMRELGMWDVSDGLGEAFGDVEQFLGRCRFADCRHQSEPGCAVRQAIEEGALNRKRWESYVKLINEAAYSDDRFAYIRQKSQRNRVNAKSGKQRRKEKLGKDWES